MGTKKISPLAGKLGRDVFFGTSPDLPKIIEINVEEIRPNPHQPRKTFNEEALQELATSIDQHGLIQPITVKRGEDHYLLVAGERRFRAHQRLGRLTIPAIVTEGNVDEIALIENIQRENLDALETAEALKQMAERYRYTQEVLGQVIGKKQGTISELLKLNELPEIIKTEYRTSDNRPPKSVLIEITRLKAEDEQLALWAAVKQGRLTVKAARARKTPTTGITEISPINQSLSAGRKFVRLLESLEPTALTADPAGHALLVEVCRQINALLDSRPEKAASAASHTSTTG
jgi:ParB family chromosome partitioning protein